MDAEDENFDAQEEEEEMDPQDQLGADAEEPAEGDNANGSEDEASEDEEENADRALTRDEACDALSQLAEVGGGLNHAYVKLTVAGLALTDVSVAKEFKHVRYADFSDNYLTSASFADDMKELLSLDLSRNRLRSGVFGPLPYLQRLNLSGNKLKTLSGVDHPHLEYINLANNRIKDASTLTAPSVTHLDIAGNNLVSLDDIAIKTLKTLNVSENELRGLEGIEAFTALESFAAENCGLTSIDGLAKAPATLRKLDLRANVITSLESLKLLSHLVHLEELLCAENPIAEEGDYRVEALVILPNLKMLDEEPYEDEEREEAAEIRRQREEAAAAAAAE